MASCPRILSRLAWLVALCGACLAARAASTCDPRVQLALGQPLSLQREAQTLSPVLKVPLTRDVRVRATRAVFGMAATDRQTRLTQDALLPRQALGLGKFDVRAVRWEVGDAGGRAAEGDLVLAMQGRRFAARVVRGKPLDADGGDLPLAPDALAEAVVRVARGAMVTALGDDEFELASGAELSWSLEANAELPMILATPAALAETVDAGAGPRLNVTRPTRVVPGGLLEVQVQAPGFNFREQPIAFCFSAIHGPVQVPGGARLLSQTGAQALFEVRVPGSASSGTIWHAWAADLWDQIFGVPSQLRVIGYAENRVVLDSSVRFNLANAWTAFVAGLAVVAALFIVFGLLAGQPSRRLQALQSLLLHASGRYSLSKTQVMLWTVLVLFALVFVWVSTGEILVISAGMLVLLGISGTSSVLARAIEGKQDAPAGAPPAGGDVKPELKDLVLAEDGQGIDLMRFQMLGFTLFTWGYSLLSVLHSDGLPDIPQHLYVLMGVSNATYLGGKLVGDGTGAPPADAAAAPDAELLRRLQKALKQPVSGRLDPATLQAVRAFKAAHGLLPQDDSVNLMLVEKAEALQ